MEWFSRAIHGQEDLWRVFWVYGGVLLLIALVLDLTMGGMFASFISVFHPYGIWVLIVVGYGIVGSWLLMIWACAGHSGRRLWFHVARLLVVLSAFSMLMLIFLVLRLPPALWLWYHLRMLLVGG